MSTWIYNVVRLRSLNKVDLDIEETTRSYNIERYGVQHCCSLVPSAFTVITIHDRMDLH